MTRIEAEGYVPFGPSPEGDVVDLGPDGGEQLAKSLIGKAVVDAQGLRVGTITEAHVDTVGLRYAFTLDEPLQPDPPPLKRPPPPPWRMLGNGQGG